MGENLFIFIFSNSIDRRRVLQGRPWLLGKLLIIIREIDSDKQLGLIPFHQSPFWVKVRNLPLNRMDQKGQE